MCFLKWLQSFFFLKKVAYFLKNFQIVPVERCEACSGKKLAICIFSLQTKNIFWILDFPLSFQWQREKKGVGMANDRGQEEERGRTLEEVTVNRTGKRLVEGMGRAAVVGFHMHQCHPSVTPPAVPGWCWDQLGDNQLVWNNSYQCSLLAQPFAFWQHLSWCCHQKKHLGNDALNLEVKMQPLYSIIGQK